MLSWSDELFYRQFGLAREDFFRLCERCKASYPGSEENGFANYTLAQSRGRASSGTSGPITMELKLAVTLRLLRGGAYLDMIWYGVQLSTVHVIFGFMLQLLDSVLTDQEVYAFNPKNSNFLDECNHMAADWSAIMVRKRGHDVMKGTLLAGDGLVVAVHAPTEDDRKGLPLKIFYNRKGCFAVCVQAFVDAWCRFRFFEVSWPGSTNDITAYKQTALHGWWIDGLLAECFHMVLDEAYGSIGGCNHLTPFSRHQLRRARTEDFPRYLKMRAFNNMLSSHRITVERAFGMYVRKWGILWKPLEYPLHVNTLIIVVCSKLHNLAIATWMRKGHLAETISSLESAYVQQRDAGVFMGWGDEDVYSRYVDHYDDNLVQQLYGNHLPNPRALATNSRREELLTFIYDCGIRFDTRADRDFMYREEGDREVFNA